MWLILCSPVSLLWTATALFWRRKWQSTPVFLPEESCGQRSLVDCRLWGCPESLKWLSSSSSNRAQACSQPLAEETCTVHSQHQWEASPELNSVIKLHILVTIIIIWHLLNVCYEAVLGLSALSSFTFNPHHNNVVLSPFYRWKSWSIEKLRD